LADHLRGLYLERVLKESGRSARRARPRPTALAGPQVPRSGGGEGSDVDYERALRVANSSAGKQEHRPAVPLGAAAEARQGRQPGVTGEGPHMVGGTRVEGEHPSSRGQELAEL
jgi:hypothetical protein